MKSSENALNLIKKYEGLRLEPYVCAGGVLTIGYGHTGNDVKAGMRISETQAINFLKNDIVKAENQVNKYQSKYNFNQNEYDALCSFAFNIGSINQLTANGTRDRETIRIALPKYCNAGGKKLQGLVNRRNEELALFNTPIFSNTSMNKPETRKTICKGDKNNDVGELQRLLLKCNFKTCVINGIRKTLKIDNDFGEITEKIFLRFQKCYGLKPDCICGCKSWKKLYEVAGE